MNGQNVCSTVVPKSRGLENAFVGTGWSWKPHKSKEHIFLHRNYTQKNISTPKKKEKFSIEKKSDFFDEKKSRKIRPKIENFRFSFFLKI